MTTEVYYENFWDCPKSGTKNISALRKMRCPNCGGSKTTQDYENDRMEEITDSYGLQLAKSGKNWECSYCHSVNLDTDKQCQSCHASRSAEIQGSFRVEDVTDKVMARKVGIRSSPSHDSPSSCELRDSEACNAPSAQNSVPKEPRLGSKLRLSHNQKISLGLVGALILILGFVYWTMHSYPGSLTSFYWERTSDVQIYKTLADSGWNYPSDAYNIRSRSRVHHYDPIYETRMVTEQESYTVTTYSTQTSYTSNGNGSTRAVTRRCSD